MALGGFGGVERVWGSFFVCRGRCVVGGVGGGGGFLVAVSGWLVGSCWGGEGLASSCFEGVLVVVCAVWRE